VIPRGRRGQRFVHRGQILVIINDHDRGRRRRRRRVNVAHPASQTCKRTRAVEVVGRWRVEAKYAPL
jgi:hypothetical protein